MRHVEFAGPNLRTLEAFFLFFTGDSLGSGLHRAVYENSFNNEQVFKICTGDVRQNVIEYEAWHHVDGTDIEQWFAPCLFISEDGRVLIQKRTEPMTDEQLPDKVPSFFTDIKKQNWGMLEGRPVCHDYAFHLLIENGMTKRMRKANWEDY